MPRVAPAQRPGKSEQTVETPEDFLDAVKETFGALDWDLACTSTNKKAPNGFFHDKGQDALAEDWYRLSGNLWLNPPYGDIAPWVKKAATNRSRHATIFALLPASVGANWFWDWVVPYAHVYVLSPRLKFVGHEHPFPKDLMLCVYSGPTDPETRVQIDRWRWK